MRTDDHDDGHSEEEERDGAEDRDTGREILDPNGPCMACGAPNARIHASPEGPARLCPTCATLAGLGCP